jgi:hypothetical protein
LLSPGVVLGIVVGLGLGFAIGSSPGIALYATVPSSIEGLGFGLAFVVGLVGLIRSQAASGPALLACAIALGVGTTVGVAVRPAPRAYIGGSLTLAIDAVGVNATVPLNCTLDPDTQVSGSSIEAVSHVDGRDVTVMVWISRTSGANLSLTLNGVPDSTPFVSAREYTWSVTSWAGSGLKPSIVLADMPMPTPVPVPDAPPMRASGVVLGSHLASGHLTFTGLQAISADQPIGTWPLVLDGRLEWSCNQ